MRKIIVERVNRDGGNRIALRFPYDQELNGVVKAESVFSESDDKFGKEILYAHL
jgi:hypothetical protein